MVDNRRLIDRNDSPPSNPSQISDFSDSDNRRNTHLHIETLQLSSKVLQRSPEVAALIGGPRMWGGFNV